MREERGKVRLWSLDVTIGQYELLRCGPRKRPSRSLNEMKQKEVLHLSKACGRHSDRRCRQWTAGLVGLTGRSVVFGAGIGAALTSDMYLLQLRVFRPDL